MKQKLSGPIEAHGPFIKIVLTYKYKYIHKDDGPLS